MRPDGLSTDESPGTGGSSSFREMIAEMWDEVRTTPRREWLRMGLRALSVLARLGLAMLVIVAGHRIAVASVDDHRPVTLEGLGMAVFGASLLIALWLTASTLAKLLLPARIVVGTDSLEAIGAARLRPAGADDARLRAVHEAGHAVAVHVLGHEVQSISIVPRGGSGGRVAWRIMDQDPDGPVRSSMDYIVVCLAGEVAQARLGGSELDVRLHGHRDDRAMALSAALALCLHDRSRTVSEALDEAVASAHALVSSSSEAILALADALVLREEIDGEGAQQIMTASIGAAQEPR